MSQLSSASVNYQPEHAKARADFWPEFVDAQKRWQIEESFWRGLVDQYGIRVLDTCSGAGVEAIGLSQMGCDVTANEEDPFLRDVLQVNLDDSNLVLPVTDLKWKNLAENLPEESFDMLLCVGNSLTYLFTREDQLLALHNFKRLLKKGGVLVLDERNYMPIKRRVEETLAKGKPLEYTSSCGNGSPMYCGETIVAYPVQVNESGTYTFHYKRIPKLDSAQEIRGQVGDVLTENREPVAVEMYPFSVLEVGGLLQQVEFERVATFSDLEPGISRSAHFYQHLAIKG